MPAPRRRPRQQRSQQTVEWILEAAARLFGEHGHAGTTTNAVAELAGVSIGSLYQYFPDKDALLAELARRHADAAAESAAAAVQGAGGSVRGLVCALVQAAAEPHTDAPALHLVLVERSAQDEGVGAAVRAAEDRVAAVLGPRLAALGTPRPALAALLAVQGINAQLHGAVLAPPEGCDRATAVQELVELWIRALEPRANEG